MCCVKRFYITIIHIASRDNEWWMRLHYIQKCNMYINRIFALGHLTWCETWSGFDWKWEIEKRDYSHFLLYFKGLCAWNFIFIMYKFICHMDISWSELMMMAKRTNQRTDSRTTTWFFHFVLHVEINKLYIRNRLKVWEKNSSSSV